MLFILSSAQDALRKTQDVDRSGVLSIVYFFPKEFVRGVCWRLN